MVRPRRKSRKPVRGRPGPKPRTRAAAAGATPGTAQGATGGVAGGPVPSLRDACLAALAAQRGVRRSRRPPLAAGQLAAPITLSGAVASSLFRLAFLGAAGVPAGGSTMAQAPGEVVWTDGDSELLVRAGRARLVPIDGFLLAGLPVYTEQTGEVEVVVPFATGTPRELIGLVVAAEHEPRGPPALMARWGDPLLAAAWQALVNVAREVAAASGVDERQDPLLPAALSAGPKGLQLRAQARFAFDRSAT